MKTAGDIIAANGRQIISISPDTSIRDALNVMVKNRLGAVLVKEKEEYVGIWTERDLIRDVLRDDFDSRSNLVRDSMITDLKKADVSATLYDLMDKFLGLRLRHLLIEKDGKCLGLLSIGDVIKAELQDKKKEVEQLNAIASWEYYEEWKPRTES